MNKPYQFQVVHFAPMLKNRCCILRNPISLMWSYRISENEPRAQECATHCSWLPSLRKLRQVSMVSLLFKFPLPKSTLFNNDFNGVIYSKCVCNSGERLHFQQREFTFLYCPFHFSFSQISKESWLPSEWSRAA